MRLKIGANAQASWVAVEATCSHIVLVNAQADAQGHNKGCAGVATEFLRNTDISK